MEDLAFDNEFDELSGGGPERDYDIPPELDEAVSRGWIPEDKLAADPALRRRQPEPEPDPEPTFDMRQWAEQQTRRDEALVSALGRIGQPQQPQAPEPQGPDIPFEFRLSDEIGGKFDDDTRAAIQEAMNEQGRALAEQVAGYVKRNTAQSSQQAIQVTQQNAADERWFHHNYPEAQQLPDEMQQEMARSVIMETQHLPISNRDRLKLFGDRVRQRVEKLGEMYGASYQVGTRSGGQSGGARSSVRRRTRIDPNGPEAIGQFVDAFMR